MYTQKMNSQAKVATSHRLHKLEALENEGKSTMIREEQLATAHKRAAELKAEEELIELFWYKNIEEKKEVATEIVYL